MTAALVLGGRPSGRAWLEDVAACCFAGAGVLVVTTSIRRQRPRPWAVAVNVAVGSATLLAAPAFAARNSPQLWTDWPVNMTFLVDAEIVCSG
jgi:hypothetical protein